MPPRWSRRTSASSSSRSASGCSPRGSSGRISASGQGRSKPRPEPGRRPGSARRERPDGNRALTSRGDGIGVPWTAHPREPTMPEPASTTLAPPRLALGAAAAEYEAAAERARSEEWVNRLFDRDVSLWTTDTRVGEAIADRLGWLDAPAHFTEQIPGLE